MANSIQQAIALLESGDFQSRWEVAKLFPGFGVAAIAPLSALLSDEDLDPEIHWFAARILGEFGHPEAVMALASVLQTSEDEDLRAMAVAALRQSGEAGITVLSQLLTETSTQLLAVQALAQISSATTLEPLLSMVNHPQATIRVTALEALSHLPDPRVPPALVYALEDAASPVRRLAVISLGRRADLLPQWDLVALIQPRLWDLNLEVAQQAAIALGRLGTSAAIQALDPVLRSATTPLPLQIAVIRALGWSHSPEALACLEYALGLEFAEVCEEAVSVLSCIEDASLTGLATQLLVEQLQTNPILQTPALKQAIASALGHLGQAGAIDALIQLLADPDLGVRLHAITALKQLAPHSTYRQLETLAQNPALAPALRQGIRLALQEW
ncbi:MAG: HEAT repeat domain-containing protein [Leptolyngbyaceae bacterium]|nr:HEAT repeat domain-containing protein [Leptolyngbyaceae bacterium]